MTDPKRQTIMEKLEDQLQTILTTGGYNTNLGSNVFEWRDLESINESSLPCVEYRDTRDVTIGQTFGTGQQEHLLNVELTVIMASSTPKVMRQTLADIITCLGANLTLGGNCTDIMPISDEETILEHENKKYFGLKIVIQIQYVTTDWNAYS